MDSNNIVKLEIDNLREDSPVRLKNEVKALEAELHAKIAECEFYKLKNEAILYRYTALLEIISLMIQHDPEEITQDGRKFLEVWRATARNMVVL